MATLFSNDPQMANSTVAPAQKTNRQRVADALVQMGGDTGPIQSWTQGLGRLASGLVGGYMAGQNNQAGQNAFNTDQNRIAMYGSAAGQGIQQPMQRPIMKAPSRDDPWALTRQSQDLTKWYRNKIFNPGSTDTPV
jgi:hypothetical protein